MKIKFGKKALLLVLFSFIMLLAVACGGTNINSDSSSNSNSSSSTKPETSEETVAFSHSTLELALGESATLTTTVTPAESAVEWKISGADSIITFDDDTGLVTAVGVGEAKIVAQIGYSRAECVVTVLQTLVEEYSITFNRTFTQITVGQQIDLVATVRFGDTVIKDPAISWQIVDGESVSLTENGKVTAEKVGESIIRASFTPEDINDNRTPGTTKLKVGDVSDWSKMNELGKHQYIDIQTRIRDYLHIASDYHYSINTEVIDEETQEKLNTINIDIPFDNKRKQPFFAEFIVWEGEIVRAKVENLFKGLNGIYKTWSDDKWAVNNSIKSELKSKLTTILKNI